MNKFPSNNKELEELIISLKLKPDDWVYDDFSRTKVMQFAYVYAAWQAGHGAPPRVLSRRVIDRYKKHIAEGRRKDLPVYAEALERVLDAGANPDDLSTLVTEFQMESIGRLMYFIGDPSSCFGSEIADELRFGLYTEDNKGNPIPESAEDWYCLYERLPSSESLDDSS